MDKQKIVRYDLYCGICKYEKTDQAGDPCHECLSYPARESSIMPLHFKPNEAAQNLVNRVREKGAVVLDGSDLTKKGKVSKNGKKSNSK